MMDRIFGNQVSTAFLALACLGIIAGCGGEESSPPVAASGSSPAQTAGSAPGSAEQSSDQELTGEAAPETTQVSYGGEEAADSESGFSGGDSHGPGADDEDDGSGTFGGPGFSAQAGRGQGGAGARGPSIAGRTSSGGPGGAPPGSRGPPPGARGGSSGSQFFGSGSDRSPDSEDADFGLDTPSFGGLGAGRLGPGDFGAAGADGANLLTGFVQQFCISCHSANNPKGDFRLDQLSTDIALESPDWRNVLRVIEDGSMPPQQSRQPDASVRAELVEFLRAQLGSTAEATFLQQAENAYKKGDLEQSLKLFYAHALVVEDSQAAEVLDNIRLYRPKVAKPEDLVANNESAVTVKPSLKTQLKLAVGIILKADSNVTEVKPIGTRQGAGGMGSAGDIGDLGDFGRGGGLGDSGIASDDSKLNVFEDLTGDYGKVMVNAFESRRNQGKYGTLFATLKLDQPSRLAGAVSNPGSLDSDVDFGMGDGPSDLEGSIGIGGRGGAGPMRGGPGRGGPGAAGFGGMGIAGTENRGPTRTLPGQNLANGLVYLGKGTISELLKKAVESGADGLFVFDISSMKNNRSNRVTTDTRLRFLLASGKVVATSPKTLNNWEIERANERANAQEKDTEEVQKQVDHVFNRLDAILSLDTVPPMSEAAALKHLHGQIHSGESPLQVMAQARLLQSKGIITQDQLAMVYQIVLEGNEGVSLATGTEADKMLVLNTVMPDL